MTKKWRDLTRKEMVQLSREMNGVEMAHKFGVTDSAVYHRLKILGLSKGHRKMFTPDPKEFKELYGRMSMADMAKHYGVGETVIFKRVREFGLEVISRSQRLSGKPKSLEHRLAMSKSSLASGIRSGKKNGNWKGGISGKGKRARSKVAYFEWKAAVLRNAGWKCEKCGAEHGHVCEGCGHRNYLHAHHKIPFGADESKRYDPNNGEALCQRCHYSEHYEKSG